MKMSRLAAAAVGAGVMLGAGISAAVPATVDGTWSVSVATTAGPCDASFRFPLQIANGRVFSRDISGVYGRVDRRGGSRVSIRQPGRAAYGSGRLAGNSVESD